MIVFLIIQTLLCLWVLCIAVVNNRFMANIRTRRVSDDELPSISVCVPARNEESGVAACVRSLIEQDYPRFEILVLDDCSEDRTAEIVERIAQEDPRVKLMRGAELPPGWIGKVHACHQMSERARGEYLFFTDADTVFEPGCLRHLAEVALTKRVGLVTGCPRLVSLSLPERLVVPLLGMIFGAFLPLRWMETKPSPMLAGGSGAFLFFKRDVYDDIGGHAALKDRIVEDIELSRAIKRQGHRIGLADGGRCVYCRMYESWGEVWEGFTKNIASVFELRVWPLVIPIVFFWVIMFLPWVWFLFGAGWGWGAMESTVLPLVQISAISIARVGSDRMTGRPDLMATLLLPVSCVLFTVITVRSLTRVVLRQSTPWRGRSYALWKDRKGEIEKS